MEAFPKRTNRQLCVRGPVNAEPVVHIRELRKGHRVSQYLADRCRCTSERNDDRAKLGFEFREANCEFAHSAEELLIMIGRRAHKLES